MRLTDDELREVLSRAEEIQRSSWDAPERRAELEAVIGAAEEVGIPRTAVERALRERHHLPEAPPAPGTLAFASSADGNSYVAEVMSVTGDNARVRFLRGSEHVVTVDKLRPCVLIPGEKVMVNWPWWGPWMCTIISYDSARQLLELTDGWGSTHTTTIEKVWLAAPRKPSGPGAAKSRGKMLLAAGAVLGAAIGSIVTAILLR